MLFALAIAAPVAADGSGTPGRSTACLDAYPNGVQTHGIDGWVEFQRDAQLLAPSIDTLATPKVTVNSKSSELSCGSSHCRALKTPVKSLQVEAFRTTTSTRNAAVPRQGSATFGEDGVTDYGEVTVADEAALTLGAAAGSYRIRNLSLGSKSTLNLLAGDYWIERFQFAAAAVIKVAGSGTARLYVKEDMELPPQSLLNANTGDPARLILYHYGSVTLLPGSEAHGLIYAGGTSTLQPKAHLYGGVTAGKVMLRPNARVTYRPNAASNADFGNICDVRPPQLIVDVPAPQTENVSTLLTGTVTDPEQFGSGVASVIVRSANAGNFTAALSGESFTAELPLSLGDNTFEVTASDLSGNTTTVTVAVQRISPPRFATLQPPTGSEVSEPVITLSGEIVTAWPPGQVSFYLNDAQLPLSEAGAGTYRFQQADVTLQVGPNIFVLRAVTPGSTEMQTLSVVYTPPPDLTPPNLYVNNPDGQSVEALSVPITGTVSDPVQYYSGVASVVIASDRFAGAEFGATIQDSSFHSEVPLALGVNRLIVTASDLSGNRTEAVRIITRTSPLALANITPVNGAVITAETVTVAGEVRTQHPPEAVRVFLNEWQTTPSGTGTEGIYRFDLHDVPLQLGQNSFLLSVQTPDKSMQRYLNLAHTPEDAESIPAPELSVVAPFAGSLLSDATFRLRGHVVSHGGPVLVTIDGRAYGASTASRIDYHFDDLISFPDGEDMVVVRLQATDTLGKNSRLEVTYHRDGSAPQLVLDNPLGAAPAVNPVMESPYPVSGTVIDDNLASLTLNDQPLRLRPGAGPGRYDFAVAVPLAPGAEAPLAFVARDLGGNRTAVEYLLRSEAEARIDPLLPAEGAEFLSQGDPVAVQVAARLSEATTGMSVVARVGSGDPVTLALGGTLASGDVQLPAAAGEYAITFQLLDGAQRLLASASRQVKVHEAEVVTLQLLRHEPENGEAHVEPNRPVELYFNKTIDPAKLAVQVRETLHGHTYLNSDPSGADFLAAQGYQLQEVHRDMEAVPGAFSVLPGNQGVAFYPARHFGFNAEILVDVVHDGEELGRFLFKVRKLPTFVVGGVADQFGQPLRGVKVALPGLGRTTLTNDDGSFAFGFQEQPGREIPGGRGQMVINPDFATPGYGTQVRTVNLQEGRKNDLALVRLQELHPEVPFQRISGGQADVRLANGELQLDLSEAQLLFVNGRTTGEAQVQFFPYEQLGAAVMPGAVPHWAFATQPRGIRVEGRVGIRVQMPSLNGGYDYILSGTDYVVLIGYDAEREVIQPIGIGRIENGTVSSVGKIPLETLDYLGYAFVAPELQGLLHEIAAGNEPLHALLAAMQ